MNFRQKKKKIQSPGLIPILKYLNPWLLLTVQNLYFSDTSRARKDGEIDGQDYHFITRAQFEADILSRKFVEHGEYEKAYYGKFYSFCCLHMYGYQLNSVLFCLSWKLLCEINLSSSLHYTTFSFFIYLWQFSHYNSRLVLYNVYSCLILLSF